MLLSSVVDDLVKLREQTYRAYRTALRVDGDELAADLGIVVDAVKVFADPLARLPPERRWHAGDRERLAST